MNEIAILADGEFPKTEYPLRLLTGADAVICCDGAAENYLAFSGGKAPDAIVGDMDTLSDELKDRFAGIITKYDEQDYDDLAKALRYAIEKYPSAKRYHILGACGGAEDFTIGNFGLLMEFGRRHPELSFEMVTDRTTAFPLCGSGSFLCGEGRTVSVFSPDPQLRIESEGLVWPLDGVCFDNWWKGIRNRASKDEVTLRFSRPSMVLVILQ